MATTFDYIANYEAQGYQLPDGWTPELVAAQQAKWDHKPMFVPLVSVSGVTAWGVPMINGQYLKWRMCDPELATNYGKVA